MADGGDLFENASSVAPTKQKNSETEYVWCAYKRLNIFPSIGRVGCQMLSKRWRMMAAW